MEVNDSNLGVLSNYLSQTFGGTADQIRSAEKFLQAQETTPGFGRLLLALLNHPATESGIRQAGAVYLKNFVRRRWPVIEGEENCINDAEREEIKSVLLRMMLGSAANIQKLVSSTIYQISLNDFPTKWPTLIQELVDKCNTKDFAVINGVLKTAHAIFRRYRGAHATDEVIKEIILVIKNFGAPMVEMLSFSLNSLPTADPINVKQVELIFRCILSISKIFYSLNYIDLPEFFEDHIPQFFDQFFALLNYNVPPALQELLLGDEDDPNAGLLTRVQAQICSNCALYAEKYEDEFNPQLGRFAKASWDLLLKYNNSNRFDKLITHGMYFLTTIASGVNFKMFGDANIMNDICKCIVIPNMEMTEQDEDNFDENPIEYIRRDIEGSDLDTRRRSAFQLVRALRKNFQVEVTNIFATHIQTLLAQYSANPSKAWKAKDIAIYLITSLAVTGITVSAGATATNELVPLVNLMETHIFPELVQYPQNHPVVQADSIKFLFTFRQQIPQQHIPFIFEHLNRMLTSNNYVVTTYASECIYRYLTLRNAKKELAVNVADFCSLAPQMLGNLFGVFKNKKSLHNEYIIKAIMKIVSVCKAGLIPVGADVMNSAVKVLEVQAENPSNPHFNHYLFETFCALVKFVQTPELLSHYEATLMPAFQYILTKDITEFSSYVFQLMAILLDTRKQASSVNEQLLPAVIDENLWKYKGNIPSLVQLLKAYLRTSAALIAEKYMDRLIEIISRLIAGSNDHHGFSLASAIVENLPAGVLQPTLKRIFILCFKRLQQNKTARFCKLFIVFFSLVVCVHGTAFAVSVVNEIQANIFFVIVDSVWVEKLRIVNGLHDQKLTAVATIKVLLESPLQQKLDSWNRLLAELVLFFEQGVKDEDDDNDEIEIEDIPGFDTAYSRLAFADVPDTFSLPVSNPRAFFQSQFLPFAQQNPQAFSAQTPQIQETIQRYLSGSSSSSSN